MKSFSRYIPLLLFVALFLTSCGYHNPYVYTGPSKSLYMTTWKNRTSQLRLDADIHQSFTRWFQKSDSINITKHKDGADLILAGEIISIDLPSLSYGANNTTTEVKVHLQVRYIMKDLKTNRTIIEVPNEIWTENYTVSSTVAATSDNEDAALEAIIDDLSEKIYLATLTQLQQM